MSGEALILIGLALALFEAALLGMSTVVFLTTGLALMATGAMIELGLMPAGVELSIGVATVLTVIFTTLLWKPIKQRQKASGSSDLLEIHFTLDEDLLPGSYITQRVAGISFEIRAEPDSDGYRKGDIVSPVEVSSGQMVVALAKASKE